MGLISEHKTQKNEKEIRGGAEGSNVSETKEGAAMAEGVVGITDGRSSAWWWWV